MPSNILQRTLVAIAACLLLAGCATSSDGVRTVSDYRAEATAAVDSITADEALALVGRDDVVFVDVRVGEEIERAGSIDGALHVPRGMLEFYIDPASGRHDEAFASDKTIIFYCATGGRSVLATKTALDMGVANPVTLEGGYQAFARARDAAED